MKDIIEKIDIIKKINTYSLNEYKMIYQEINNIEEKVVTQKQKCRNRINMLYNSYQSNIGTFSEIVAKNNIMDK